MKPEMLEGLSTCELLEVQNFLADQNGVDALTSWRSSPRKLVDLVRGMKGLHRVFDRASVETHPPLPEDREPTVKELACSLLCTVERWEHRDTGQPCSPWHPEARSLGMPYSEVLERVMAVFPEASTTLASIRWYAVQINDGLNAKFDGYLLPGRRPRKRHSKSPPATLARRFPRSKGWLNSSELCEELGITQGHYYYAIKRRTLVPSATAAGRHFFRIEDLGALRREV